MRKLILSLLTVIWTTISIFSQSTYPKKLLIENDTVVAITVPQLITINRSLNDYTHLKSINRNLLKDLIASDSICDYLRKISLKKDTIYFMDSLKFEESLAISRELKESLKIQKKKSRKTIVEVGVGGTLLGVLLGVLLR